MFALSPGSLITFSLTSSFVQISPNIKGLSVAAFMKSPPLPLGTPNPLCWLFSSLSVTTTRHSICTFVCCMTFLTP